MVTVRLMTPFIEQDIALQWLLTDIAGFKFDLVITGHMPGSGFIAVITTTNQLLAMHTAFLIMSLITGCV